MLRSDHSGTRSRWKYWLRGTLPSAMAAWLISHHF
jgi:hypothetical protein